MPRASCSLESWYRLISSSCAWPFRVGRSRHRLLSAQAERGDCMQLGLRLEVYKSRCVQAPATKITKKANTKALSQKKAFLRFGHSSTIAQIQPRARAQVGAPKHSRTLRKQPGFTKSRMHPGPKPCNLKPYRKPLVPGVPPGRPDRMACDVGVPQAVFVRQRLTQLLSLWPIPHSGLPGNRNWR